MSYVGMSYVSYDMIDAIKTGNVGRVTHLLRANPKSIEYKDVVMGNTPLIIAVNNKKPEIVQLLIDNGANVNNTDMYGSTALMAAALKGKLNIVSKLLDAGANVNHQNVNGNTALHYSTENGDVDIVRRLKQAGADHTLENKKGESALKIASQLLSDPPYPIKNSEKEKLKRIIMIFSVGPGKLPGITTSGGKKKHKRTHKTRRSRGRRHRKTKKRN